MFFASVLVLAGLFYFLAIYKILFNKERPFLNSIYIFIVQFIFAVYFALNKLFTTGISNNTTCLVGKTALVTGGNAGLGFIVAKLLASRGCTVIIADKDDSEKSKRIIIEETENPNIITKRLNLASFASVRKFAADISATVEKLDILINNAGIMGGPSKKTEDGLDLTMQVNHFGPFLLTHLLVDLLKKSAPSRIIFATSCMAFQHHLSPEELALTIPEADDGYSQSVHRYSNSKLCNIITADYFADMLSGSGVTVNTSDPSIVKTAIFNTLNNNYPSQLATASLLIFNTAVGRRPYVGAQTMFHIAAAKELEKVTGKNFSNCKPFLKPPIVHNRDFCRKICEVSEKCVKLTTEEKLKKP